MIPGHGNNHPVVFDLLNFSEQDLLNVSVIAGHFSWNIWTQLPSVNPSNLVPPCLVMGIHPADRVVSDYYQSCYQDPTCSQYNLPFNNLTAFELTSFITSYRQAVLDIDGEFVIDEGYQDVSCRALVDRTVTDSQSIHDTLMPFNFSTWEQEIALKNIESCVVGLHGDWVNTKKIIDHWFPWIEVTKRQQQFQTKVQPNFESGETIRPALRQIIEEMNICDLKLYEKMKNLFAKQLLVTESDAYL